MFSFLKLKKLVLNFSVWPYGGLFSEVSNMANVLNVFNIKMDKVLSGEINGDCPVLSSITVTVSDRQELGYI